MLHIVCTYYFASFEGHDEDVLICKEYSFVCRRRALVIPEKGSNVILVLRTIINWFYFYLNSRQHFPPRRPSNENKRGAALNGADTTGIKRINFYDNIGRESARIGRKTQCPAFRQMLSIPVYKFNPPEQFPRISTIM